MIGSHNTMTYLKPQKWWMQLINFTSRCQSKDIEAQYAAGVRYFDIRVCIGKHETLPSYYGHGIIRYKAEQQPILQGLLLRDGAVGRIILEKGDTESFRRYIDTLLSLPTVAEHIHYAVDNKKTWNIYRRGTADMAGYTVVENYPAYPKDGLLPWPRLHNRRYIKPTPKMVRSTSHLYLCDFI